MEGVRHMNTVIESPLERALTDIDLHRKYPEAAKLLREVTVVVVKLRYFFCELRKHSDDSGYADLDVLS